MVFNAAPCSVLAFGGTLASGGATSSCTTQQIGAGSNGITGVKLFGSGDAFATNTLGQSVSGGARLGNSLSLDFFASGGTNGGNIFGVIPLHYAFSVTDSDSTSLDITYNLVLSVNGNTVFSYNSPVAIKGDGTLITGDLSTINLPSGQVLNYSIDFSVTDGSVNPGDRLSVTIPPNSVAINQASGVPEPSTFGLLVQRWRPSARWHGVGAVSRNNTFPFGTEHPLCRARVSGGSDDGTTT